LTCVGTPGASDTIAIDGSFDDGRRGAVPSEMLERIRRMDGTELVADNRCPALPAEWNPKSKQALKPITHFKSHSDSSR